MRPSAQTVSLTEAATILGIHRTTAYELHKKGQFPVPVIPVGRHLKVSKVSLERLLAGEAVGGPSRLALAKPVAS